MGRHRDNLAKFPLEKDHTLTPSK